ncbi:MAG: hypothetical protein HGB10_07705 [Coriobacteriia bacterium]|nr:hypothetical protein [Coriobacteriia bacterium]
MSLIIVAALIITGILGAVAVAVAVPAVFGLMAFDAYTSRDADAARIADAEQRIQVERGFARAFVIAGGSFWTVATFAGLYTYAESGVGFALISAFIPLVAALATMIVGWYFERAVSVLLVLASFALVVYGAVAAFELGVWAIVTIFLIGPMMTAAALFWMARRDQEALELSLNIGGELATVTAPTRGPRF